MHLLSPPDGPPRPPLTARYRVLMTPVDARQPVPPPMEWHCLRDEHQVRHLRGGLEHVWTRRPGGLLRYQLLRHGSAPAAPGPRHDAEQDHDGTHTACWATLTSFIDAWDLRPLRTRAALPSTCPGLQQASLPEQGLVDLLWETERQLPLRMTRLLPTGTLSYTLLRAELSR